MAGLEADHIYNIVSKGDTFQDPNNEFSKECLASRRDELVLLHPNGWLPISCILVVGYPIKG